MSNFKDLLLKEKQYQDKYNYLIKLGFTENQALTLSVITYNSFSTKYFLSEYEKKSKKPFCDFFVDFSNKKINDIKKYKTISDFLHEIAIPKSALFSSRPTNFFGSKNSAAMCKMDCESSIEPNVTIKRVNQEITAKKSINSYNINTLNVLEEIAEDLRTDQYHCIEEKGFVNVINNPTSTFRTTTNTAAFSIICNNVLKGMKINKSAIRIEEMLNSFDYVLNSSDKTIEITTNITNKKDSDNKLLFVGLKGKEEIPQKQNIVFLLDNSGSMFSNAEVSQLTFLTLLKKLNTHDILSLITYSDKDEIVLESLEFDPKKIDDIILKFLSITIQGCTYGSKGITSAYNLIASNFINDGINKVIIMTDGDFNFGLQNDTDLKELIAKQKLTGAYLSVIGTGTYNLHDNFMETLAKNGNGNYIAVNSLKDVDYFVNNHYNQLVYTIATDVKAQVEFNPTFVKSYRLIGYENRQLNHEDFSNDEVISDPFLSGASAVALYELELNNGKLNNDLKYQKISAIDSNELCTVKVRFKELKSSESTLIEKPVLNTIDENTTNVDFAYLIAQIGEGLRNSEFFDEKAINTINKENQLLEQNKDMSNLLRLLIKEI